MRYLPTVTEVIEPWVDFSRIPAAKLQAAQERGTAVHEVCTLYARGIWPAVAPEYAGYFDSFRRWYDKVVDELILAEERLFSEAHGYCGQMDLIVKVKGGERWLVDLKTPIALLLAWRVQLSAYKNLDGVVVDRSGSLRLDRDGRIPAMNWYDGTGGQDFTIFLSALNCWRYFKQ